MASSIVHMAITNELTKVIEFQDSDRLRLGSIFPDYGCDGCNSHLKKSVCGNKKVTYDLEQFRNRFLSIMLQDDFYLGYYLHLVQDILYRKFVYKDYNWNPVISGNVEKLHRDYAICNSYVIEKYSLSENMISRIDMDSEAINKIGAFNQEALLSDFRNYFVPVDFNDIFFFTREMGDEFIQQAVKMCAEEIHSLRNGGWCMNSHKWAWKSMPRSLIETT